MADSIDLVAAFTFDEAAAKDGAWIPYQTASLLLASVKSEAFQKQYTQLLEKYPSLENRESEEAQIWYEAMIAKHLLLSWQGFTEEYSPDAATKYLRLLPAFKKWVLRASSDDTNFVISQ
jgi:hypothetical protein